MPLMLDAVMVIASQASKPSIFVIIISLMEQLS